MSQLNVCGLCKGEFDSVKAYVDHMCETTGFTPKDPDHQGPEFVAISEAAKARGEAKKPK